MDEIRFVAGPIVGRYLEKIEEERQAAQKIEDEKVAKKKAELDAKKKAEDEAKKKAEDEAKKGAEPAKKTEGSNGGVEGVEDVEMKDADVLKADEVEEPEARKN